MELLSVKNVLRIISVSIMHVMIKAWLNAVFPRGKEEARCVRGNTGSKVIPS